MNAREYITPDFEVVAFDVLDVIATSEPVVAEVPALENDIF